MPLYRALTKLSSGVDCGQLTRLEHLTPEQIAKLEQVGAVARVAAPPLSELPDWASRAGKLAKAGIQDAEQFLDAEIPVISRALHVKAETAARYQDEVKAWLVIQPSTEE
jgi:hypothetical protein